MNNLVCIVIPIYKQDPDVIEILSFNRLYKIIKDKYDVCIIKPKSLNISNYDAYLLKNYKIKEFDDKYFESTDSYSHLMVSYDFYNSFSNYEYILIYQGDCYLFKDEIIEWCNKGYDYIGAPILSNTDWQKETKRQFPLVGNGGLSLRKISKFMEITDPEGEFRTYYNIDSKILENIKFEDLWFCTYVYDRYEMNIPNWNEALKFSWDIHVKTIIEGMKIDWLPMGCHAWPKNIRDWKDRIEEINDEIVDYCEKEHKEWLKVYYSYYDENKQN